jgi:hypothetical protein
MALKKLTPIEKAIYTIDDAIKDLELQRQELMALLPNRSPSPIRGYIIDHRTGKKRWWNKRLKREYEMKKKGLKTVKG